jgi:Protein  of unknown function (DUF3018)
MGVHERMTGAERVAKRRATLRAKGLKLRQFWVPDLSNPSVRAQLAREAGAIRQLDAASDVGAYLESIRTELWAGEPDYDWGPSGPPSGPQPKDARAE